VAIGQTKILDITIIGCYQDLIQTLRQKGIYIDERLSLRYHIFLVIPKSITCNPNFNYHYDIPCDARPARCSMSPNPNPNPNPNPLPWLPPLLLPPPRLRNSSYPKGNSAPLLLAPSVPRPCGDKSSNKKMSHNNVLIFIEEKKRHKLTSNSCAMAQASVEWFSAQA